MLVAVDKNVSNQIISVMSVNVIWDRQNERKLEKNRVFIFIRYSLSNFSLSFRSEKYQRSTQKQEKAERSFSSLIFLPQLNAPPTLPSFSTPIQSRWIIHPSRDVTPSLPHP
jgi:hypothetical protein